MVDIRVTFPTGPSGPAALVRFVAGGMPPQYRMLPLGGDPAESVREVEDFILAHLEGPGMWQGWLWEA